MSDDTATAPTPNADAPSAADTATATPTKDEITLAVEAARKQEKDKLYSRLQELDSVKTEMSKRLDETNASLKVLLQERDDARKALNEKAQAEMTAEERVAARLKALEERESLLQQQLERVATEAASRIRESELKVYRANKIAESGLTLTELVNGSNEAEIDAAILRAKEREETIFAKAREQVRGELSKQLPKPMPSPATPATPTRLIDPAKKFEIANLPAEDFNRLKAELLAKARSAQ